jgi:hypothetical protein
VSRVEPVLSRRAFHPPLPPHPDARWLLPLNVAPCIGAMRYLISETVSAYTGMRVQYIKGHEKYLA